MDPSKGQLLWAQIGGFIIGLPFNFFSSPKNMGLIAVSKKNG
jgi:hypothetical protein